MHQAQWRVDEECIQPPASDDAKNLAAVMVDICL